MSKRSSLSALLPAVFLHIGRKNNTYLLLGGIVMLLLLGVVLMLLPPAEFPVGEVIEIEKGVPFSVTAAMLEERNVIGSALVFELLARGSGSDERIQAGRYVFDAPLFVPSVLHRLVYGMSGIPTIKVTFPEGTSVREMAVLLKERFPLFDSETFFELSKGNEGYLFPDTYLFETDIMPEQVRERLIQRFYEKTRELGLSEERLHDVVIVASLVEEEANTREDRRLVSGILWKRNEIGMALQVDAVFGYIQGTTTYHPTGEDLEIDSPYNTYLYRGLPPGPITNPGLDALQAAYEPTETDYLYYLTGDDGITYYAKTFEEHKRNKELYLQ